MSTPSLAEPDDEAESNTTSLPGLRTWRMVYATVVAIVTGYVVLLTMLTRWFQ
jgi:hypothetical protein